MKTLRPFNKNLQTTLHTHAHLIWNKSSADWQNKFLNPVKHWKSLLTALLHTNAHIHNEKKKFSLTNTSQCYMSRWNHREPDKLCLLQVMLLSYFNSIKPCWMTLIAEWKYIFLVYCCHFKQTWCWSYCRKRSDARLQMNPLDWQLMYVRFAGGKL